ncbi:MAG: hypothetical protein H7123_09170, partial [Thermoleophilia bacterium]|nr:hypothetical protein [Thermoleophilia bacterium]
MKLHFTKLFTVANVCAMLALFVALGGVSYAAVSIPRNSVASKQVKNESLTGRDIKNNTLVGADIKESSLIGVQTANTANTANTATTANTANTLSSVVDSGRKLVTATSGVDAATALAAAPKVSLLTVGSLSLYGKCYTDASGPSTHGEVFIATTLDGVVFDSDQDDSNSAGSNF